MFCEPSFYIVRQEYADESLSVLHADTTRVCASEYIPYDQMNRDIQQEAQAGGWQGETIWQNPAGSGAYW